MTDTGSKKKANLRDVARESGFSVATVSRVLNTPDIVNATTRKAVQAAIDALHFVPSAAARSINSGRSHVVGALVPTLDNAIFSKFLGALEAKLSAHGLSLVVATTGGDPDVEAQKAQGLVDIGAEALCVSGVTHSPEFDHLVARTRMPTIATSFYQEDYRYPTIGYDNAGASRKALEFLWTKGHIHIAVLHGPTEQNDRMHARLSALQEHENIINFKTEMTFAGGGEAVSALLRSAPHITAILCLSDVLALGASFELHRRKVQIPDQMSLIGIDDLPSSACAFPAITTVRLPAHEMGILTADAIAQWVEQDAVPEPRLIDTTLIIRESA
ncbi:LacI family DNA-binding transcriptional regulator [Leisingera sp.]|uniref:LacI family DNA-binding transcriptional regulator n=1 Tax=Leisingera sp. TaxID=1879318 RepID=UPI002B276F91|nr:LacI family DNA-binding transcriptional regulator [Leisingera sp.]